MFVRVQVPPGVQSSDLWSELFLQFILARIKLNHLRYFFHIGYDGTNYGGWQWQVDVDSVQGQIEYFLKKVFKKKIVVYGCGRTDSGVHASQYFFHVDIDETIDFDFKFR